jgi:ribonucleoside-diphosphate reductase beta chain
MSDIHDFSVRLTDVQRNAIKNAMLAISQIEISVKKFWTRLGDRFPKAEFEQIGVTFGESEVRHADAYSHLLEVLGLNNEFDQLLENPVIQGRVDYLKKYLTGAADNSNEKYTLTLTLFSIFIENVSLFSQFVIIKSFNKHLNCLKDIDNVVQATQKEEVIHALLGVYLIKQIQKEFPEWFNEEFYAKLYRACKKAFESECNIIDWIFEAGELDFLPKDVVKEFVKNRFNESLEMIGGKNVFEVDQEKLEQLKWFNVEILAEVNTDFFHKKPVTYSKKVKPIKAEDLF